MTIETWNGPDGGRQFEVSAKKAPALLHLLAPNLEQPSVELVPQGYARHMANRMRVYKRWTVRRGVVLYRYAGVC